jgi:hypothetical protein
MPDPLLTNKLYDDFLSTSTLKDKDQIISKFSELIPKISQYHRYVLYYLLNLLKEISKGKDVNLMDEG